MLEDLENALAEHAPAGGELASELPPLTIDGIPVSVDKMTQVRFGHGRSVPPPTGSRSRVMSPPSRGRQLATNQTQRWFVLRVALLLRFDIFSCFYASTGV